MFRGRGKKRAFVSAHTRTHTQMESGLILRFESLNTENKAISSSH